MSKVAQVVRDALLHLRAIDQHQTPEAQEVEDAIRQMNMLVREWEVNSLPLGWVDVANPDECTYLHVCSCGSVLRVSNFGDL